MSTTPLVDIIMPTYNHEKFIVEAIDSVLAQKTGFAYRLIVADDCSTDETQAIVRHYAGKYPDKVEFVFSAQNLGPLHRDRVSVKLLNQCTAKYVTILEGDDYWTDPYKLQKQVDFLERHTECSVCFHNAEMFYDDGSQPSMNLRPDDQKEISTVEDVIAGMVPIPCTVLFRNNLLGELPECFYQVTNADWMMSVLLAEHGHIGYINEVMAAYRMHPGGMWSRLNRQQRLRGHIHTYKTMNEHMKFKYDRLISDRIAALNEEHARWCLGQYQEVIKTGELRTALSLLMDATHCAPLEVLRPRLLASVLKNGLLGIFWKATEPKLNSSG
ncbi:MAG: glycosyltransferase [Pyrinomonadaceae bacterium]|nr:glycosyltransferase [Pyrinomonadaceae bacterium]